MPAARRRRAERLAVTALTVLLAALLAGCARQWARTQETVGRPVRTSLVAAGLEGRPTAIRWLDRPTSPNESSSIHFTAITAASSGFWLSAYDVLMHIDPDGSAAELYEGPDLTPKGLAEVASQHVWLVGFGGGGRVLWPAMAEWSEGDLRDMAPEDLELGTIELRAIASPQVDEAWAVGAETSERSRPAIVRYFAGSWRNVSTETLGDGALVDVSFAGRSCGWALGRRRPGDGFAARFDGETWQPVGGISLPAMPGRVSAISCNEAWFAGTGLTHYVDGESQTIALPQGVRLTGLANCGDGSLLAVGAQWSREAGKAAIPSGVAFRIRAGQPEALDIEVPFALAPWGFQGVACRGSSAWAFGTTQALGVKTASATAPLLFSVEDRVCRYRGWDVPWTYYLQ